MEGGTKTAAEERSGYVTHVTDLHPSDGRGVAERVAIDAVSDYLAVRLKGC